MSVDSCWTSWDTENDGSSVKGIIDAKFEYSGSPEGSVDEAW